MSVGHSSLGGRWRSRWTAWVVVACVAVVSGVRGASFRAVLDRSTAVVGEAAVLSLNFEGGEPAALPSIPGVAGLTIQYSGRSTQVSIINGRTSSTISHNYAVTAAREGEYVIPALQVRVGGQVLSSEPLRLKVTSRADPGGGEVAAPGFLRLVLPRTNLFVGEALAVEVHLYATGGQLRQLPQIEGEGVTVGKLQQDGREAQVQVGNTVYYLVRFRAPLVVAKTGELRLTAGDCVLEVQYRRRNNRPRTASDPFGLDPFDDFFGRTETRQFTLRSEPEVVRVRPLPVAGQPPGFTGAVGRYEFTMEASPTNVAVGDPITVRFRVQGTGALDGLQGPGVDWPGFKVYPPNAKTETSDLLGLTGVRVVEQVVVPEQAEVREIPPVVFSYFDPEREVYRSIGRPAIPLVVRPSAVAPAAPTVMAEVVQSAGPPRQDILHIKPRPGVLALGADAWLRQWWFLALQVAPLGGWLGVVWWRRRVDALAANPRWQRRRQVAQLMKKGLGELDQLAEAGDAAGFFALVFRLLQERLGQLCDLPASAITEAVLDERLRPEGVPPALVNALQELFQACHAARYAPSGGEQALSDWGCRVREVLADLEKIS